MMGAIAFALLCLAILEMLFILWALDSAREWREAYRRERARKE